jgi:LacI family transcriptional regulator
MRDDLHEDRTGRAGMREVAERAGVAASSVSRVLSGHPDVSKKMRARVMAAVEELGYQPDMLAQGLRSGRTYSVGFALSNISNPVLAQFVTGAERRLRERGYSLLLTNSEGSPELDADQILLLGRRRVDGLILSLAEEHHARTVDVLRQVRTPIVLLDRDVPPGVHASCVAFDHHAGMGLAVEHLLKLGHRTFALIIGGPDRPARERQLSIEETLQRANVGATLTVHPGEFSVESGRQTTLDLLARRPRPTAMIAGGNMLMHGALQAFRDTGVEVGRDVSFVGCDDVAVAELHKPQIAVVKRDLGAAGEKAAELLLAELESDEDGMNSQRVELPSEFVARASCGPPPG